MNGTKIKSNLHGADTTLVEHSLKTWREPFDALWKRRSARAAVRMSRRRSAMSNETKTGRTTPYQRIVRAANRGTGCRLSAEDCVRLSLDTAIVSRAEWDDIGRDEEARIRLEDHQKERERYGA